MFIEFVWSVASVASEMIVIIRALFQWVSIAIQFMQRSSDRSSYFSRRLWRIVHFIILWRSPWHYTDACSFSAHYPHLLAFIEPLSIRMAHVASKEKFKWMHKYFFNSLNCHLICIIAINYKKNIFLRLPFTRSKCGFFSCDFFWFVISFEFVHIYHQRLIFHSVQFLSMSSYICWFE